MRLTASLGNCELAYGRRRVKVTPSEVVDAIGSEHLSEHLRDYTTKAVTAEMARSGVSVSGPDVSKRLYSDALHCRPCWSVLDRALILSSETVPRNASQITLKTPFSTAFHPFPMRLPVTMTRPPAPSTGSPSPPTARPAPQHAPHQPALPPPHLPPRAVPQHRIAARKSSRSWV